MNRNALPILYLVAVCFALCLSVTSAPLEFNHQGRLLDAVGTPVSGSVQLVFRLYDDSTAGTLIWTETHPSVSVNDGLFSVTLGSVTPFDADMFSPPSSGGLPPAQRFLEIEASGEVITPRVRLVSIPYAVAAHRIDGDVTTAPNQISIGDLDDDGLPDLLLVSESSSARLAINRKGTSAKRTGVFAETVPGESSEIRADGDFNEDGFPDIVVGSFVSVDSAGIQVEGYDEPANMGAREKIIGRISFKPKEGATGARLMSELHYDTDDDGFPEVTAQTVVMSDSILDHLDLDDDGDGIADAKSRCDINNSPTTGDLEIIIKREVRPSIGGPGASALTSVSVNSVLDVLDTDSDGDGFSDQEISSSIVPTKSQHAINTKGTGAQNGRVVSISSSTEVDSALSIVSLDDDGDGLPENYIYDRVKQNESKIYICHGTADKTNAFGVTVSADSAHMSLITDGTGLPEGSYGVSLGVGAVAVAGTFTPPGRVFPITTSSSGSSETESFSRVAADSDDDGLSDAEAALIVTPTTSSVAIKTKGTGADANRVVSTTNDSSAEVLIETDSSSITLRNATGGLNQCNMTAANASNAVVDIGVDGETTTLLHSLDVDADGLADIASVSACTIDSAYESTTFSYPNASSPTSESGWAYRSRKSKTYQEMHHSDVLSRTAVESSCDSVTSSAVWSADDFSGLPATSLTIQASTDPLLNPIEHSSGAHLTPGGTWTNSSDANLKENFESIDGYELLEKLDQLDIQKWNYTSESDSVRHIGPTAQDFEKAFNLGTDGKSISTIDPAGIALAAIKALNEKSRRVDELEKDMKELKRIVKQLLKREN